jgi:hypothetical protein
VLSEEDILVSVLDLRVNESDARGIRCAHTAGIRAPVHAVVIAKSVSAAARPALSARPGHRPNSSTAERKTALWVVLVS